MSGRALGDASAPKVDADFHPCDRRPSTSAMGAQWCATHYSVMSPTLDRCIYVRAMIRGD